MELAALGARIDSRWKIAQQFFIELAACEACGQLLRVDAGEARTQAAGNHVAGERVGRDLPERKERLEAGGREIFFAIGAHIFKKQVTESEGVNVLGDGALTDFGHALLVDFVRAGPGERNDPKRKSGGGGLRFEDSAAHAVHGDAIKLSVDRGDQAAELDGWIAAEDVE